MDNTCENMEEYNPDKNHKVLIVFDDMITDMFINKKINPILTEFFIRDRKLNISLVFITQSYFTIPRNIRLNSRHYFMMKIPKTGSFNKSHLIIHFINIFRPFSVKPYSTNHILSV